MEKDPCFQVLFHMKRVKAKLHCLISDGSCSKVLTEQSRAEHESFKPNFHGATLSAYWFYHLSYSDYSASLSPICKMGISRETPAAFVRKIKSHYEHYVLKKAPLYDKHISMIIVT